MGTSLIMDGRHEFSYKRPTLMVTIKKSKIIRQKYFDERRLQIQLFLPIIIRAIAGLLQEPVRGTAVSNINETVNRPNYFHLFLFLKSWSSLVSKLMSSSSEDVVSASFEALAKNIEPSIFEYASVNRCRAAIQEYLGQYISSFTIELPGAFARTTMVSPLKESVIDMLVLFNMKHSKRFFPGELLNKLHVTLRAEYPGTTYDEATEAVYVPVEEYKFKVQPGFITNQRHYLVPAPHWNEWVQYDSIGYKSLLLKMNAFHKGKLLHVIRMIKTWNRLSGTEFNGYFLELLVNEILVNHEIQSYQSTINYIFRALLYDVALKQHDPANDCLLIEGLHDLDEVVNAMLHVKCSYLVSKQALEFEEQGKMKEAISDWAQLFPEVLPS